MVRKPSPDKKALFFSAAIKLFVQNGVSNTSTAAIAQEAGTAAGTLFIYFPTKQDLINELALQIGEQQSQYVKSRLEPTLSVRDTFYTIWDAVVRWFMENMDAYLYIQQVRHTGMLDEATVQESNKFFDYYYHAIQKGLAEGAIKPYAVELIGETLYQDIVAVMNLINAHPGSEKQEQYIFGGYEMFWNGIKQE
ncbi:MAG: TetR/AcrR family transcriptional regulator [Anaerolineales bacterium]|jgi:AcrR family transcriptional regulator